MNNQTFKPTTDLHYHIDAMSARAIFETCKKFDLPWSGKTFAEIKQLAEATGGGGWDEWYKVHTEARKAIFRSPEIFEEVMRQAIIDAELEGLETRVMRFSLSMPDFCFQALFGRKPDLENSEDKGLFLNLLDQVIYYLGKGIRDNESSLKAPLVFSISCQDKFLPMLDDVAAVALNHKNVISGTDLTNEQTHRLVTDYIDFVKQMRSGGIGPLVIHVAEKEPRDMIGHFTAGARLRAALRLDPQALGHTIWAVKYPQVIVEMANSGVVVELCPSSNISEDYVERGLDGDVRKYPLPLYHQLGIPCTINSDTPGTSGSTLLDEFFLLQEIFDMDTEDMQIFDDIAKNAAQEIYGV